MSRLKSWFGLESYKDTPGYHYNNMGESYSVFGNEIKNHQTGETFTKCGSNWMGDKGGMLQDDDDKW